MKVTSNVKYIPAGVTQYIVDGNDGEINVDTSVSAVTIILPNIINSGYTNTDKGFIINDFSGNAGTNNITLVASNNTVNSQSSVLISVNGGTAKCSIASMNEWFVITEPSTGGISGTLTANYIPKAATSSTLTNSIIYQDGHNIAIGTTTAVAKLHVLQNTVGTGAKAFSVNFATIGETFYLDDNGYAYYYGGGFTVAGSNATLNLISNGGVNPMLNFKYNNGSDNSGVLYGSSGSMFLNTPAFGIGGAVYYSPQARVHIQGVDATSSNYALKVDNSSSSPLLYIRNDHYMEATVSAQYLRILSTSAGSLTPAFLIFDTNYGEAFRVEGTYGRNYMGTTATSFANAATLNLGSWGLGRFLYFGTDGSQATITDADGTGIIFTGKQKTLVTTEFRLVSDEGFLVGNGNTTAYFRRNVDIGGTGNGDGISRVFIKGIDSTSATYSLNALNSSGTPLLYARNDGEIGMNGFTIRQLSSTTFFKTSGTGGYMFNNAADSTNLGKITNIGQILFGDITDVNYVGVGIAIKATSLTSDITKECNAAFFKSNTDQDGVFFSSKQGSVYIQSYSINTVNQSLILGGRNSGTGVLETLILKSSGVVNAPTMPTSSVGLVAGDLWNNAGVVNIV